MATENSGAGRGQYVCNVSVDDVMNARKDPVYQKLVNQAVLTLPNSRQLSSEMHLQGYPKACRINVVDLMERIFVLSNQKSDLKHYFVCGRGHGEAEGGTTLPERLQEKISREYPYVNIAGISQCAGIEKEEDDKKLTDKIRQSEADIIWVGMPSPLQEKWMAAHQGMFLGIMIGVDYGLSVYADTGNKKKNDTHKGIFYWPAYIVNRCRQLPKGYVKMTLHYFWLTGKKFILRTFSWAPALATILTILILSSQNGVASGETSRGLTMKLFHMVLDGSAYVTEAQMAALEALDALIRMAAHMGEYAFLSLMIGLAVTVNGFRGKIRMFYMCFLATIVSVADEFFQIFVPGRYGDLKDVAFDFLGILTAAVFVYIAGRNFGKRKTKGNEEKETDRITRRKFMNLCLDDITFDEAVDQIGKLACAEGKHYVVTPNVDHVVKIEKDIEFRRVYEDADLILTDGTPLMWIADSLGCPIKEKIPGADMFPRVCEMAAKEGYTMFFFGAGPGVAEKAKENLQKKYPGLRVVGTYSPPIGFEKEEEEVEKAIRAINQKSPQILVVALGAPKQEKFIYHYKDRMNFHVALSFGAAVDFEAGMVRRAPLWMRKLGLEWLFRFFQEPGRLFKRYFIDDMKIFWLAWKYRYEIIRMQNVPEEHSEETPGS
ncbi:MAG: VanZ family protein [Lachnospiraceae bacterium]